MNDEYQEKKVQQQKLRSFKLRDEEMTAALARHKAADDKTREKKKEVYSDFLVGLPGLPCSYWRILSALIGTGS